MGQTNGQSTRFGDTALAFGVERLSNTERSIWRFKVMRYIGNNVLLEIDADPAVLREAQRFIEKAIEIVESDGGRKGKQS